MRRHLGERKPRKLPIQRIVPAEAKDKENERGSDSFLSLKERESLNSFESQSENEFWKRDDKKKNVHFQIDVLESKPVVDVGLNKIKDESLGI